MPLRNQLHVNKLLSNVSVKYTNGEMIWDKCFPTVPVMKDSDSYRIYDRNFRMPSTSRAPKGLAKEFSMDYSLASYLLQQDALKDYVGVDETENNDIGSVQIDVTENLTDAIYRKLELNLAALFVKANWSLNVSLTTAWTSNTATTDPVPVYDTGTTMVIQNSGKTPNFGIMSRDTFVAVKNHVSVLDRVKYTSSEVSKAMIQALIGLPAGENALLVPTAIQETSFEGATLTTSAFFSDMSFLGWKPASPSMKSPSCGYTFMRSTPRVRSWFDEERNATAVEVEVKHVHKVVASLTGFLIGNCV